MYWDIVWKNIRQRRLRALLTILGVAAAVQLYLTMSGIMRWYDQDLQTQLRAFAGKVVVQRLTSPGDGEDFPSTNSSISAETALAILSLDGIDQDTSSAALFVPVVRALRPFSSPRVMAVGIEPGHEAAYIGTLKTTKGQARLTNDHDVILGYDAALYYGGGNKPVEPGQTIEVMNQNLTVVGVLEGSSALLGGAALMPLATAQQLFGRNGTVSAVILTAPQVDKTADLEAVVEAGFPDLQTSGQGDISRSVNELLINMRKFFQAINATVIAVAIVMIMIVMIVAVMERRREIGTLRAIGARRRVIFTLIVSESLVLSLVGVILALPLTAFANNLFFGYFLSTEVFVSWLQSFWVAMMIGVVAALLPAWQAVRVDPLEALRYE